MSLNTNSIVVIDPGHGWGDPGAMRAGMCEADLTLGIATHLAAELTAGGQTCLLTRNEGDVDKFSQQQGLARRVQIANSMAKAICFVSIHLNSMPKEEGGAGIEVFYQAESLKGITLAREIESVYHLDAIIPRRLPMVKPHTDLCVLRKTRMPAVLVECGFITNPKERAFLSSKGGQRYMAQTLAAGIFNWLTIKEASWKPKSSNNASITSPMAAPKNGLSVA